MKRKNKIMRYMGWQILNFTQQFHPAYHKMNSSYTIQTEQGPIEVSVDEAGSTNEGTEVQG